MTNKEYEIYSYSAEVFCGNLKYDGDKKWSAEYTERCVEVPWVASCLRNYKVNELLDIGFTFASHDYLRIMLDYAKTNNLMGTDIIDPKNVLSRYPETWLNEILRINVVINDILCKPVAGKFDAITMISTIEHVGFDKRRQKKGIGAFERAECAENVDTYRNPNTENVVLNNLYDMLKEHGKVILSVPAGKGGIVLLRDSLGLYTCEHEYNAESWHKIIAHEKFKLIEQKFYRNDGRQWEKSESISGLSGVSANMKDCASGVALCVLEKI